MKSTFLCSCRSVLKDCAPRKKSIYNKHILMVDLSEKKSSCTCGLLIMIMLPNQVCLFSINQCHIECIYSLWMHENKETQKHRETFVDERLKYIKLGKKKTSGVNSQEHLERSWLFGLWMHTWQTRLFLILGERLETCVSRWKRSRPLSQSQRPKYSGGTEGDNQAWKSTDQGKSANDW